MRGFIDTTSIKYHTKHPRNTKSSSYSGVSLGLIRVCECRAEQRQLWAGVLGQVDAPSRKGREGKRVNDTVQGDFGDLSVTALTEERRL